MEKKIDLRGLVCPEPVLRTKRLLDDASIEKIEAMVDSEVNVRNLTRLASSQKVSMTSSQEGDHFRVVIKRGEIEPQSRPSAQSTEAPSRGEAVGDVVFIKSDTFGEGDRDFSINLLNVFVQTIKDSGHTPRAILMANTGVRLMDPDGTVRAVLDELREKGCEVLACGLCVDYYGLKGKIPVEQITNMFSIVEYLMSADKVVSP